jgi:dihydroorotase
MTAAIPILTRFLGSGKTTLLSHALRGPMLAEAPGARVDAHPVGRDELSAQRATERCLRVARRLGRRVHILHVSTADELDLLEEHRDLATFEVTPQHLTLSAPGCYESLGTLAQTNPPMRDAQHCEAIWHAVRVGLVDVLLRLVELVASGPARVCGIARKGRIAVGADGDLTFVYLKRRQRLTHAMMRSACGWTPFEGLEVVGFPGATLLRGRLAMPMESWTVRPRAAWSRSRRPSGRAVKPRERTGSRSR